MDAYSIESQPIYNDTPSAVTASSNAVAQHPSYDGHIMVMTSPGNASERPIKA